MLLSWALPDGPSCSAGAIRKAIEMQDHGRANLLFEGVHETGPIMLWDRGTWEPQLESDDIQSALRRGVLRFTLRGEKLKGGWTLARINSARNAPRPVWTLCKQADSFAESRADKCVLEERPNSVDTGKTMRGNCSRLDKAQGQIRAANKAFRRDIGYKNYSSLDRTSGYRLARLQEATAFVDMPLS